MGYFLLCEQDLPTILTPLAYHDAHDGYDYYHGRNKGHMLLLIMFPTQSMLFSRPDIDTFVGSLSTVLQFA